MLARCHFKYYAVHYQTDNRLHTTLALNELPPHTAISKIPTWKPYSLSPEFKPRSLGGDEWKPSKT